MPLTFAHPAIVLPLRRWLPIAALAAGAMAPDVPYFIGWRDNYKIGHVWPGVVTVSIPAAIVLWLLWRWLLRDAVVALLPAFEQQKLQAGPVPFAWSSARAWLGLLAAVVIGVASHVVLDGVSHREGWGVEHIGFLSIVAPVEIVNRQLAIYKLIQYLGSIIGMGILALVYLWWSRTARREETHRPVFAAAMRATWTVLMLAAGAWLAYRTMLLYPRETAMQVGVGIVMMTKAVFVGLLAVGAVARALKRGDRG